SEARIFTGLGSQPTQDDSEFQSQSELHHSRITRERGDLAHRAAGEIVLRLPENHSVGNIEDFPAKLQIGVFGDAEIANQGSVKNVCVWADQSISARVANRARRGYRKGIAQSWRPLGAG